MKRQVNEVLPRRELVWLAASASVREAAVLMKKEGCGAVLVMEGTALLGIFTERDVVNRIVAEGRPPDTTALGVVMTPNPTCVDPDELALTALRIMEDGGFRHLPVARGGQVIGVISRRDFFGAEMNELERERHYWNRV